MHVLMSYENKGVYLSARQVELCPRDIFPPCPGTQPPPSTFSTLFNFSPLCFYHMILFCQQGLHDSHAEWLTCDVLQGTACGPDRYTRRAESPPTCLLYLPCTRACMVSLVTALPPHFIRFAAAHLGVGGGEMNPDPNAKITISTGKV